MQSSSQSPLSCRKFRRGRYLERPGHEVIDISSMHSFPRASAVEFTPPPGGGVRGRAFHVSKNFTARPAGATGAGAAPSAMFTCGELRAGFGGGS